MSLIWLLLNLEGAQLYKKGKPFHLCVHWFLLILQYLYWPSDDTCQRTNILIFFHGMKEMLIFILFSISSKWFMVIIPEPARNLFIRFALIVCDSQFVTQYTFLSKAASVHYYKLSSHLRTLWLQWTQLVPRLLAYCLSSKWSSCMSEKLAKGILQVDSWSSQQKDVTSVISCM